MVTLCTILLTSISEISANSKKGKALVNFYKNPVSINFIVPGGGRHGTYFTKKFREIFDIRLGLVILCNFALGKAALRRGIFIYITGVTP